MTATPSVAHTHSSACNRVQHHQLRRQEEQHKPDKNNNVAGFDKTAMFVQRIFGHAPIKNKKKRLLGFRNMQEKFEKSMYCEKERKKSEPDQIKFSF